MKNISRKTILISAVALIIAVTAVTVLAQPFGMGMGRDRGHERFFVEPILIGHGFAIKGDEYHVLDVNAIRMGDMQPGFMRSLIWQKKNPQEIANEIQNRTQIAAKTRAHIRFAGQAYALNVTEYDNGSFAGDVQTLPAEGAMQTGFIPAIVGHITISSSKYEGDVLSTGTLTMNGTDYNVLMTSPMRLRNW